MSAVMQRLVSIDQVESNRRRGGDVRTLLSPKTVGSTSGFSGAVRLLPGERVAEHYHPYSEEFLFLVRGSLTVDLDDEPVEVGAGDALFIPIGMRHRLRNLGDVEAFAVFHLGPLAPRPELGHVDTESTPPSTPPPDRQAARARQADGSNAAAPTPTPGARPAASGPQRGG